MLLTPPVAPALPPRPSLPAPRRGARRRRPLAVVATVLLVLAGGGTAGAAVHAAARDTGVPAGGSPTAYRAPVDGEPALLRAFDLPPEPWLPGHRGVDLRVVPGGRVLSPATGVVTFAGDVAGRGVVVVTHPDGRRSSLEPVTPGVAAGARVLPGSPLGTTDGAHAGAPGPALHWGVREGDRYLDPWALLPGRGPVVLLPLP